MIKTPFVFTPTKDFFSPETRSFYSVGLTYTVRPGNEALAEQVEKWLKDSSVQEVTGKVAAITGSTGAASASVAGKGTVK